MRVLMVCMQFPTGDGQSYLTTELADALVSAGHEVEVLFIDWAAQPGQPTEVHSTSHGIRFVRVSPRTVGRAGSLAWNASKFVLTGRHVAKVARHHFDLRRIEAVLAWMPAIAIAPLMPMLVRAGIRHRILFIWDFFPDHHHEIGRVPGGLPYRIARAWERRVVRQFSAIVCTLPGNADYLRRHYPLRAAQRVLVSPIWSDTSPLPPADRRAARASHRLPPDRPIAVFGGQLVEGRGFEQILAAADAGAEGGSPLLYLFVGDGRLAPKIRDRAVRQDNVAHLEPMSRRDYLELLGACDVGMVATVPGVRSYSIPSKTIDYLRAGLPIVAAVEPANDFIGIIERYRVGQAVGFGDPETFHRVAERLATEPRLRATAKVGAPRCLDEIFDVRHAVATIEEAVATQ